MKKHLLNASVLALVLVTGLTSCKKNATDSPAEPGNKRGEVSFTVDGDGFLGKQITIPYIAGDSVHPGTSVHFVRENDTYLTAGNASVVDPSTGQPANDFTMFFYGAETGKQEAGYQFPNPQPTSATYTNFQLNLTLNGKSRFYLYNNHNSVWTIDTPGSITVTKYEAPGGRIEGDFEGTLLNYDTDTGETTTIKITNGHFWFIRERDNPL